MKPELRSSSSAAGLRPQVSGRPGPAAFTLIEVLAAMTVLAIILMLLGQVFSGSTLAWETGTRRMDQNIGARAVMDLIAQDLSGAIVLNLSQGGVASPYGGAKTSLRFLTLAQTPDSTHLEGRIVEYYVDATSVNGVTCYQLMRSVSTAPSTVSGAYSGSLPAAGGGSPGAVADNIAAFEAYANGTDTSYTSQSNQVPRYVDIFLSMLSAADAQKAGVAAGGQAQYVEKHEKRYTTRVFLHNQKGYSIAY